MSELVRNPDCWFSHANSQYPKIENLGLSNIGSGDLLVNSLDHKNEPPRGKPNNVVSKQV